MYSASFRTKRNYLQIQNGRSRVRNVRNEVNKFNCRNKRRRNNVQVHWTSIVMGPEQIRKPFALGIGRTGHSSAPRWELAMSLLEARKCVSKRESISITDGVLRNNSTRLLKSCHIPSVPTYIVQYNFNYFAYKFLSIQFIEVGMEFS